MLGTTKRYSMLCWSISSFGHGLFFVCLPSSKKTFISSFQIFCVCSVVNLVTKRKKSRKKKQNKKNINFMEQGKQKFIAIWILFLSKQLELDSPIPKKDFFTPPLMVCRILLTQGLLFLINMLICQITLFSLYSCCETIVYCVSTYVTHIQFI